MIIRTLIFIGIASLVGLPAGAAETAYVIDKLLVGVHQGQDLDSAIVKVLPTGTKLEVVKRDGELALVKDDGGTSGWVDSAYLMAEAPASRQVARLKKEIASLNAKLSDPANASTATVTSGSGRDKLAKENTDLKGKLSAEKLKTEDLKSQIIGLESKATSRATTPADTIIADLEKTNLSLTRNLEGELQKRNQLESKLDERSSMALRPVSFDSFSTPIFVSIFISILLAFGAGIYAMDYLSRRRHGGFRI